MMIKRDWVEDAEHENGNYQCICWTCKESFIGHKRRVFCKHCTDNNPHKVDKPGVGLGQPVGE